ncbi:hypothetical protein acsn021_04260 [Anaerocolumna cellulosilytica]|uniref:Uncharacterized protein n=1 Tax=Anaerocolumna cellulosilytica TaxID=433286 RepID=A0A6S6QYA3_9FIRM|nr:5-bromo-4-chloroindolyl phosphate hydrolysis family protein [Anaerocolumna cellulosilytica]MBB5195807.1 5-bromo-4-chloroindolyl phosphate hydrolysis protein [Anaerocolumna cellulosilytica]BCJ92857.1 hypothetical protein acsn021_04260 [Anaerocolumna cellulosilytica]
MNRKNFTDLGDEIKDIVQNAVNSRDFHQLNRDISHTVKGALEEVKSSLNSEYVRYRGKSGHSDDSIHEDKQNKPNHKNRESYKGRHYSKAAEDKSNPDMNYKRKKQYEAYKPSTWSKYTHTPMANQKQPYPYVPVGKTASILYTIFGSIGMSLFGTGAFILALIWLLAGGLNLLTISLSLLPFFFISGILLARGSFLRKRLRRFYRYMDFIKSHSYYSINDLSSALGLKRKYVIKDLRKMVTIGMFPEGRFDEQETCIMLNHESYKQYKELIKNVRMQEIQSNLKEHTDEQADSTASYTQEVRNAIEAGRACIQQIRDANDAIPGEEVSRKLDRLEEVVGKIFLYIEQHPSQLADIKKFMDYYLPTTLKLVNAYKEFDILSVQGDNISNTKNEIEETLTTINHAFENLLDSLYEDVTMDVSSDISVLETLLAQEGLTQKDFVSND